MTVGGCATSVIVLTTLWACALSLMYLVGFNQLRSFRSSCTVQNLTPTTREVEAIGAVGVPEEIMAEETEAVEAEALTLITLTEDE